MLVVGGRFGPMPVSFFVPVSHITCAQTPRSQCRGHRRTAC